MFSAASTPSGKSIVMTDWNSCILFSCLHIASSYSSSTPGYGYGGGSTPGYGGGSSSGPGFWSGLYTRILLQVGVV